MERISQDAETIAQTANVIIRRLTNDLEYLKTLASNAVREYPVASGIYVDSDGRAGYGALKAMRLYLGIAPERGSSPGIRAMTYLSPNGFRGLVGLIGATFMVTGADILWGAGAAMFVGGVWLVLDASSDEAIERFTKTTRYKRDGRGDVGGPTHG